MLRRLTLLSLILLALQLPFELQRPLLQLGPLALTNVELPLYLALGLALLQWQQARRPRPPAPTLWIVLGALFLAGVFVSALLAPEFRTNALLAALRTASGIALTLAVTLTASQPGARGVPKGVVWLTAALLAGGAAAAALGLAELLAGAALPWLAPVRVAPTVAGPFLRLSGPFDYANQAAMYLEATLPLLLAVVAAAWEAGRRPVVVAAAAVLVLYTLATLLTFSRSGLVTLILVLSAVALLLRRRTGRQPRLLFAGGALLVLLLVGLQAAVSPAFAMRLTSESDNNWYLADFEAPAEMVLRAGEERLVTITVTNEGAFTWRSESSPEVYLAARWIQPASERELSARPRWPLERPVKPGDSLTMQIPLRAPDEAGSYTLFWDVVQEHVVWFSAKTGRQATSAVTVTGSVTDSPAGATGSRAAMGTFEESWEFAAPIPGRLTLWRLAAQLWQARPLLGVGLDNFRLLYGRPLQVEIWNTTIHSNNWYVETLVSSGLLGSLPFFLLLALLAVDIVRVLRRPGATVWQAAVGAGLLAYLIHGMLDYFLLFNATGLLFWLLLGLWLALRTGVETAEGRP